MARPTFKETERYESLIVSRSDHKYDRIDNYFEEEFINNIIFEFFLRDKKFVHAYNRLCQIIETLTLRSNYPFYPLSEKFNKIEKIFQKPFYECNYDVFEITRFIYCDVLYRHKIETQHNYVCDVKVNKHNLFYLSQMLFKGVKNNTEFTTQEEYNEFLKFFEMIEYKYEYPTYKDIYHINIRVNLKLSKEVLLKQTQVLLDELYKSSANDDKINIRTLVGKKDINSTFANYFYVYDHLKKGIPKGMIKSQIDQTRQTSSISINTINEHMKKMEELLLNRNFVRLSFN